MSSNDNESNGDGVPISEYRGIKRIQQACLNCRRKKAKCSGERPICGACKRLGQDCQYWARSKIVPGGSQEEPKNDASLSGDSNPINDESLSKRMATMESKLDQLVNAFNATLPPLVNQFKAMEDRVSSSGTMSTPSTTENFMFDRLPPSEVLDLLIDVYFLRVHNQPYSYFHEKSFRSRLSNNLLPDYLIFAVLASALRFSNDPYFQYSRSEAAAGYARESWKLLVSNWFATESDPNIYICQAITLLSVVDYTAGRRHPAWLKIGLSIRIAQDLRLMVEPNANLDGMEQEEHRRTFWSIYVLDRLCSCGRNRPASIMDAHCRVKLPCSEENFRSGQVEEGITLEQALGSLKRPTATVGPLSLVVLAASVLGRCAQYGIHEHSQEEGLMPPWDSKSEFASIYSILLQFETQFEMGSRIDKFLGANCLPDGTIDMQICGPLVFSHALFHTAQCLLHHPLILYNQLWARRLKAPASFLGRAFQTCRENAISLSNLVSDAKIAGYPVYFSFMGYCTVVATGIHTLYLTDDDSNIRHQSQSCFQSGMEFLEEYSQYWKNGKTMLAILQLAATQATFCKNLMNNSASMEDAAPQEIENMWAALDYASMSQISELNIPFDLRSPTPSTWNSMFEMFSSTEANPFDPMNFLPTTDSVSTSNNQNNPQSGRDIPSLNSLFGTTSMSY